MEQVHDYVLSAVTDKFCVEKFCRFMQFHSKKFHFNATLQSKILLFIVRSHAIPKEIFSHEINSLSALFIVLCKPRRHNTMAGLRELVGNILRINHLKHSE